MPRKSFNAYSCEEKMTGGLARRFDFQTRTGAGAGARVSTSTIPLANTAPENQRRGKPEAARASSNPKSTSKVKSSIPASLTPRHLGVGTGELLRLCARVAIDVTRPPSSHNCAASFLKGLDCFRLERTQVINLRHRTRSEGRKPGRICFKLFVCCVSVSQRLE